MSDTKVRPAYRELADRLRRDILKNHYRDGQRLPTEAELSSQYGLSRQTVRRAYQDLVAEGTVHRTPGRGTFPAAPGRYIRSFGSLEDLLAQATDTELEVLSPLTLAAYPSGEVLSKLRVDDVMEMSVRRLHDGIPFAFTAVSFPVWVGRQLEAIGFVTETGARRHTTVLELLDGILSDPIVAAEQVITATSASATLAPVIGCRRGQPVMRIDRLFLDSAGTPIEVAVNHFNPERYSYHVELHRNTAG